MGRKHPTRCDYSLFMENHSRPPHRNPDPATQPTSLRRCQPQNAANEATSTQLQVKHRPPFASRVECWRHPTR
jgi:hypothetical protein